MFFNKIDYRFIIILTAGIILRIISFIFISIPNDADGYIFAAKSILAGDYNSHRGPSFPLFVAFFILVFGDPIFAVKFTSFISGILIIIISYFVFSRAALKIFKDDGTKEEKSKNVGLLVSFYISINFFLIYNSARGLREEFIMILLVLLFYFIFLDENSESLKSRLMLIILVSLLTLSHVTAGIIVCVVILVYFLLPKLKFLDIKINNKNIFEYEILKDNISNTKIILIFLTFIISYSSWLLFCFLKFGNPFYSFEVQRRWMKRSWGLDMSTPEKIIETFRTGLQLGINNEIWTIVYLIGPVFILFVILAIFKYYKEKEIFFLGILLLMIFLYLSPLMAIGGAYRLLIYTFPFIFFLGSIIIIDIMHGKEEVKLLSFKILKKEYFFSNQTLFFIYIFLFIVKHVLTLTHYILVTEFSYDNFMLATISYMILITHGIFLFAILLNVNIKIHYNENSIE